MFVLRVAAWRERSSQKQRILGNVIAMTGTKLVLDKTSCNQSRRQLEVYFRLFFQLLLQNRKTVINLILSFFNLSLFNLDFLMFSFVDVTNNSTFKLITLNQFNLFNLKTKTQVSLMFCL